MKNKLITVLTLTFFIVQLYGADVAFAETAEILEPEPSFFKDVPEGSDYFTSIQYLKKAALLDDTGDFFNPGKQISRAEAVYYIFKIILGYTPDKNAPPRSAEQKPFSDVPTSSILAPYIKQAKDLKIINGYKNKLFMPHKKVALAETLKITLETEKLINASLSLAYPDKDVFSDVPPTAWFSPYAKIAKEKRIIKFGKSDEMNPDEIVTKGYLMEILYRLLRSKYENMFGIASFYGSIFDGRRTSSGETFSNTNFTAAHRKLLFGTRVRVTNLKNSKSVEVVINDRGPYTKNFTLDLSQAAFSSIAPLSNGIIPIEYSIIK